MSRLESILSLILAAAMLLGGCGGRQRAQAVPEPQVKPLCFPPQQTDKAALMLAAEHVLAKMQFTIEKADHQAGLVRTRPLPGAQFFELWRKDSVGKFNRAEANLHSIRRTIELNIREADQGLCIDCTAKTQRLSLPELQVSTPGAPAVHDVFARSPGVPESIRQMQADSQSLPAEWIDLGNDGPLAAEILKRIKERLEPAK